MAQIQKFYSGTPPTLLTNMQYPVKLRTILPNGFIIFTFKEVNEAKHQKHLREFCDSPLATTPLTLKDLEPELMVLVRDPSSGYFCREQILSGPDEENNVLMLSLDTGHFVKHSASVLDNFYYIQKDYLREPFEAFMCYLEGLEFFSNSTILGMALDAAKSLIPKDITVTLVRLANDGLPIVRIQSAIARVHDIILQKVYELSPGQIMTRKGVDKLCTVPWFEVSGEVFIHIADESFIHNLESKIDQVLPADFLRLNKPLKLSELTLTDMYVAPQEGTLYRVKYLKEAPRSSAGEEMVELDFIDYGNRGDVPLHQVRRANLIDPHLDGIPPLCHQVYLKRVDKIIDIDAFGEETGGDKAFSVRVSSGQKRNGLPVVTLFTTDPTPVNLNKKLLLARICEKTK